MRINHYCHHVRIINSSTFNNSAGIIFLQGAYGNIVSNCKSYNNTIGIDLAHAIDGPKPHDNKIENCSIYCNDYGIYIDRADDNIFVGNNIIQNNLYGIDIKSNSNNNEIYHNNLLNNNQNAKDDGTNFWDDDYPSGGNYWDDYSGVDSFHGINQDISGYDGIGDTPYPIPGDSNQDDYPSTNPDGWLLIDYPPIADADGPYYGTTDDPIHLDGSGSYDPDGTIISYEWIFGDGHTGTGVKPYHQYDRHDNYTVTLTVTDNDGLSDTNTIYANIGYGNAPLIMLIYPKGGEILKDIITVRWNAFDSKDGSNLPIYLYYFDEDNDWYQINDVLDNDGEYNWDTNSLPDGEYKLLIEAFDSDNNLGYDSSDWFTIKNHEEPPENNPPDKPDKPSGPINGEYDKEYQYTTSTTDPEGNQVWYKWYWNDKINETSVWLGPYDSGDTCEASHTWEEEGEYSIRVKAKDVYGDESPWSDPLTVTMPKVKIFNQIPRILIWLFERFPFLHPYFTYF